MTGDNKLTNLSISIVVYKKYDDVLEAVETIELYTSNEISKLIYIIDNSCLSEDNQYRKKFEEDLRKYDDVIYIDAKANLGFGKGHNCIIKDIESEFHAIVNPDIILRNDAFSSILNFMKNQTVGMCIPRIIDESGNLQKVYRRELTVKDMFIRMFLKNMFKKRQDYHTMQDMDYSRPFEVPFGQGSFLIIRTDLYKSLNGFDERFFMYMEDADLCKRVNDVSKLVYCPYAEVVHKWEKGSHKNFKLFKIHINSMIRYFKKWGL